MCDWLGVPHLCLHHERPVHTHVIDNAKHIHHAFTLYLFYIMRSKAMKVPVLFTPPLRKVQKNKKHSYNLKISVNGSTGLDFVVEHRKRC